MTVKAYGDPKNHLLVPVPPKGGLHYLAALLLDLNYHAKGIAPYAAPGVAA